LADGEPCDGELVNVDRREREVPQHGAPNREAANRQRADRERTDRDGAERGCPYSYRVKSTTLMYHDPPAREVTR
jgi:hypothetical protein